jgi:hypothetical protein
LDANPTNYIELLWLVLEGILGGRGGGWWVAVKRSNWTHVFHILRRPPENIVLYWWIIRLYEWRNTPSWVISNLVRWLTMGWEFE